ncbi:MAG: aspartate aminotransferase family protein, partial [Planctomycetota bacterium]|nr:aspartate aminotransferase family protein [Planctomycetota bacterium]
DNSHKMGEILQPELRRIGALYPDHVGMVHGKGLVASLHIVKPGGIDPDPELASAIVLRCVEKGLMMFAPVGYAGASVKVSPPLTITEEPLRESIAVLEEACKEVIK